MRLVSVLSLLILLAVPAAASIIFTDFGLLIPTFGVGNDGITGSSITNSGGAAQFSPTVSGALGSIDIAADVTGGATTFNVSIASDSSNSPGAVIESMTITGIPSTPTVVTALSSLHPSLTAGTKYWVEVTAGGSLTVGRWFLNNQSVLDPFSTTSNGGSTWSNPNTTVIPAFDVNANTVPEPFAAPLTLLLLGGMIAYRSRRLL